MYLRVNINLMTACDISAAVRIDFCPKIKTSQNQIAENSEDFGAIVQFLHVTCKLFDF